LEVTHNSFGETTLKFEAIDPEAPHRFEQKASLSDLWAPVPENEVFFAAIDGRIFTVTIAPNGAPIRFLRVVEGP
jgi:hypothetical protein